MNIFTVFLKNRNFISKIRISKVRDFATLTSVSTDRIDLINIHQSFNKKKSNNQDRELHTRCEGSRAMMLISLVLGGGRGHAPPEIF